MTYFFIFLNP